ncbi:hypothetical protein SteCoe_3113 [Stentor coeruleus]|uniref:Uncharacterized protein n=1 Tax=Stentor coeruleus TaxID=5963 RepID=A0A1R2CXS0_9CILI|nr:hypothetical protein SteCoe_3113 [Stentor coeruleus]
MDSSNLPILLEDVLSGKPEDSQNYNQSAQKLHIMLKTASPSLLQGAAYIAAELSHKGRVSYPDFKIFSDYISKIKQRSQPPDLRHLPIVNSGLKVAAICHALHKIQLKSQTLKHNAFISLLIAKHRYISELQVKRLQCANLISNIKINLGISMLKTVSKWKEYEELPARPKLEKKTTLTMHQKRSKSFRVIKNLLMSSPMAFEQQALWRWRLVNQEIRHWEERIQHATEQSNYLRLRMIKKAAYIRLKNNAIPMWLMKKALFERFLRKTELRYFYVKKIKFSNMKNYDMYEMYEEEEEEEYMKKIIKVIKKRPMSIAVPLSSNSILLLKVFKRANMRNFYALRLLLAKWKTPEKEKTSTKIKKPEHTQAVRSGKPSGKFVPRIPENEKTLKSLINRITKNCMTSADAPAKVTQLLQEPELPDEDQEKLSKIVNFMANFTKERKQMGEKLINYWQGRNLLALNKAKKYSQGLERLTRLIRTPYIKILLTLPECLVMIKEERTYEETIEMRTNIIQDIDIDIFKNLAKNAINFSIGKTLSILKWKGKVFSHLSGRKTPGTEVRDFTRAILSSVFKVSKSRLRESFKVWTTKNEIQKQCELTKKLGYFAGILNSALMRNVKSCLQMPKSCKTNDEILSNAIVALCKNLLWTRTRVFHIWTRFMSKSVLISSMNNTISENKNYKDKMSEYLLRNLSKYPKMVLLCFFSRWREVRKNNSRQLFTMISVLQRIFASKAKRVFNPPRIIKDADQIMRRTIRKLTSVKDWALRVYMLRWKYFRMIEKSQQSRKSVLKVLYLLANPTKQPFLQWKQKTSTLRYIHRSNGTSRIVQALSKVFRNRYKILLFRSLITKKRLTLLRNIWREYNKKYIETVRIGWMSWKFLAGTKDAVYYNTSKHSHVIDMVHRLSQRLNESFQLWKNYTYSCKTLIILDNYRISKLQLYFTRAIKARFIFLIRAISPGGRTKNILKMLFKSFEHKIKDSFIKWKNCFKSSGKKQILSAMKYSRLKDIMALISKDGLNAARLRILGHGSRVKGSVVCIIERLKFRPKHAFNMWKKFAGEVNTKKVLSMARTVNLKKVMLKILLRRLDDTKLRIYGGGEKVKGAVKNIVVVLKKKSKITFTKWTKYVTLVKTKQIMDNSNSSKLKVSLGKVIRRTLKDAYTRVLGNGSKTKGAVRSILLAVAKKPKNALRKWLKFAGNCETKNLMDGIKSFNFRNALSKIPKRTLKDAVQRLLGPGFRVKFAIKTFLSAAEKKSKQSFTIWKKVIEDSKRKKLKDNVTQNKLYIALARVPRRVIAAAFNNIIGRKKDAPANNRGQSLKLLLSPLGRKQLRTSMDRFLGQNDKARRLLSKIFFVFTKKTKVNFLFWVKYSNMCKTNEILDNAKSQKLINALSRVPKKILRNAFNTIIGDGNASKGLIIRGLSKILRRPKMAVSKWVKYSAEIDKKNIMDNLKSQKLKIAMENIIRRTTRDAEKRIIGGGDKIKGVISGILDKIKKLPRNALHKLRDHAKDCKTRNALDGLRTQKLKESFGRVPRRTLRDAVQRIVGDGNKVKGAIARIISNIKRKPRRALMKWNKFADDTEKKGILDSLKSQKLKIALTGIPKRVLKDGFQRIIDNGDKIKAALRSMEIKIKKRERFAFNKWAKFIEGIKKKGILDNLKSQKLKSALTNIPRRTLKDAHDRIYGDGNKVKGAIKSIISAIKQRPREVLRLWKGFVEACKQKGIFDNLRSQRLEISLDRIPRRKLKDAVQRILGDGSKAKGAIKNILSAIQKMPKNALERWRDYIKNIKTKGMLDNARAHKLQNVFDRIPRRVTKDAVERMIGEGNKIKGALKSIVNSLRKATKTAFVKWSDYIKDVKAKKLFDNIISQKLKIALSKIPNRALRDGFERIIGDGNKIKGAVNSILHNLKRRPRNALELWKKFNDACKNKNILDSLRSQKLKNALVKIPTRSTKDSFQRIVGGGSKATGAIKSIFMALDKLPKRAFIIWKNFIEKTKRKGLFDNVKSEKLKFFLFRIQSRSMRLVFTDIMPNTAHIRHALRGLVLVFDKGLLESFQKWNSFCKDLQKTAFEKKAKAFIIKESLSKPSRRVLRSCKNHVDHDNSKLRLALKVLGSNCIKLHSDYFKKWYVTIKPESLKTSLKGHTLADVLSKLPLRTVKGVFEKICPKENLVKALKLQTSLKRIVQRTSKCMIEKILGDGSRTLSIMKRLFAVAMHKPQEFISKWKNYVEMCKNKSLADKIRGLQLRTKMSRVSVKTVKTSLTRISGGGNFVKGIFNKFINAYMAKIKEAYKVLRENALIKQLNTTTKSIKLMFLVFNLVNKRLRTALDSILGDRRVRYMIKKLIKNYQDMAKVAFEELWHRVEKIRTIKKINSAYFVFRQLLNYSKRIQEMRFKYWKNLEFLRKRRMMRKSTTKMMSVVSLNYEGALWRWKNIVLKCGYHVTPKHSLAFKRFILSGTNYQKRLVQYSYYKISLYFRAMLSRGKTRLPQTIVQFSRHSRDFSNIDDIERPLSLSLYSTKSVENPSNVSTIISNKVSKDEVNSISQVGALELLTLQIMSARTRKLAWSLSAIFTFSKQVTYYDTERIRLIDQINEMRYEKHSLLEDNNTLRHHNDNLIENLEKTNFEFRALSLNIDNMRLVRMVRVVSKMIEVPMAEAFFILYDSCLY